MPEKSVREMSSLARRHYSLEGKVFRSTVKIAVILGLVLLLVGLGLYSFSLARQYISHAFYLSQSAAASVTRDAHTAALADEVMKIYRSLDSAALETVGTDAYRERYRTVLENDEYSRLIEILPAFSRSEDVSDVYIAMYDEETCALVYIVDPDEEDRLYPGEWESVDPKGMRKFLSWDGEGMLYDIDRTEKYGWMCTAGMPVYDGDGRITCFVLADVTIDNILHGMGEFALQMTLALLAVIIFISWRMNRWMKRTLLTPIGKISLAAQDYVSDRRAGIRDSAHFSELSIRTGDEIENLSLIMADMEQELADYEENLTKVTAEKERISTELSLATKIQAAMMPHVFPPFPGRSEFDIYASMDPAKEVGGDFFDFFLVDDDHLCLVMADVSGKGIPAALFMMASKIILQSCAMLGGSPAEILTKTNEAICSNNQQEMFVTVWLGILEISTGKLTAANAGHEYPVLKSPEGKFELLREKHGFVIGGFNGVKYREYELSLSPGSKLFLYTDGVPEATDASGEMFGLGRMVGALNEVCTAAPHEIVANVRNAADRFVKNAEPFDDLTMLCLEYKGKQETSAEKTDENELEIEAAAENLPQVTKFVNEILSKADCPIRTQMQIGVALEEIFVNIASYAYGDGKGRVKIRAGISQDPKSVTLTFTDWGAAYDPLAKEDPDITLSASDREVGGLGIFMTKKLMDEITYAYEDSKNILTMRKYF